MPSSDAHAALARAVGRVRDGGLVGYPTETVFGLAADATSPDAVARLQAWKGRAGDQPLSILVDAPEALSALGLSVSGPARRLAARFWPGPLTLVLASQGDRFAPGVGRADGAVGVRCSPHPTALAFARALAAAGVGPVTATSLNRSGEPPAAEAGAAARLCDGPEAPLLLLGHDAAEPVSSGPESAPSTVVDCTGSEASEIAVLREGAIPKAALEEALLPPASS